MADQLGGNAPKEARGIDDYVNEVLRTAEDFESLDSILQSLQNQQELQRKRLSEAEEIRKSAIKASADHNERVRKQAETFEEEQGDIDTRLMILTQADTTDNAAKEFQVKMEKLRRLDLAKGYMEVMQEVDDLSKTAARQLDYSPRLALPPYTRLRNMLESLKHAQPAAEGAAPHLVDYTEKLADSLRDNMIKSFGDNLQSTLEKMKWPGKELVLHQGLIDEWTDTVELMLELQEPELETHVPDLRARWEPSVLLPLAVMARPLELRFKYHFSGDKATNRLDKPEYFLSHTIDLIDTHSDFVATYFQPILDRRTRNAEHGAIWTYVDSLCAFITSLFPMLRQKIATFLPRVSDHPRLLSHFVHELMKFDDELRDQWGYSQDLYSENGWKGLTWEVLVKQDWFARWLQVEKDFALARYQNIIDAADSFEIDYDGVGPTVTKPTKAALRVNDLLETITERYRPLLSFSQKLRFLIDIQIAIFDQFHERLHSGLEAYLAMTSAIGRTVQGSSKANQTNLEEVSGLERLCRIFGSAEYLEKKMQDWSDDVFFLELWSELQDRVKQNSRTGRPVAGPMTVSDVAARTSSTVVNSDGISGDTTEGALFDETASAYRRLRMRSESIIISTVVSSAQTALRPYSRLSTWASLSTASSSGSWNSATPSIDLTALIRSVSTELSFLSRVLAPAPLRRIVRQLLLSIQTYIWDNVLMRNSFSTAGALQLSHDIDNICNAVGLAAGSAGNTEELAKVIQKLREGMLLLNLRIKGDVAARTAEDQPGAAGIGLWEAEKRIFANNESARGVLAKLNIETLTETEARAVLERRVELRS